MVNQLESFFTPVKLLNNLLALALNFYLFILKMFLFRLLYNEILSANYLLKWIHRN